VLLVHALLFAAGGSGGPERLQVEETEEQMRVVVIGVFLILTVFASGTAHAQQVKNGGLTGRIVSGTASSADEVAQPVVGVSCLANEKLIITTACAIENSSGFTCNVSSGVSGRILIAVTDGSPKCITYTPGFAIAPNDTIVCQASNGGGTADCRCVVTGVCSRR
jgi:hypothetical protein